jgi:hypothetical protein
MRHSILFRGKSPLRFPRTSLILIASLLPAFGVALLPSASARVQAAATSCDEDRNDLTNGGDSKGKSINRTSGFVHRLPQDGGWAKYEQVGMRGDRKTGGGFLTISSVGRRMVDGMDCRWLELKSVWTQGDTTRTWIAKILVPEKDIAGGVMGRVLQGWIKIGDQDPVDIDGRHAPGLNASIGGEMEEVKKLPKKMVASKLGRLECEGVTGKLMQETRPRGGSSKSTFEARLHKKAPFGTVTRRWQLDFVRDNKVVSTFTSASTLVDFGTGAKSELPRSGYVPGRKKPKQPFRAQTSTDE